MRKIDLLHTVWILLLGAVFIFQGSWIFYLLLLLLYVSILSYASANIRSQFFIPTLNSVQKPNEKTICLTFDDGPDPVNTPVILDLLAEFRVPATFFVIGHRLKGNEELLRRIRQVGHLIGNHSYSHSPFFPVRSASAISAELAQTSREIEQITGEYPMVFRPPFGVTSPPIARAVKKQGFRVLGWNIRSLDTRKTDAAITLKRVSSRCRPGSVVLFHDTMPATAEVLRNFLVFLKQHEYKVVLPDEMFGISWYKAGENQ